MHFLCIEVTSTFTIATHFTGEGDTRPTTVKGYVTGPRAAKKIKANGPATGYFFCALQEEGLLDEFIAIAPDDVSATMGNVPKIGPSSSKRAKTASSTKKYKNGGGEEESNFCAIALITEMSRNMSTDQLKDEVARLRNQISIDARQGGMGAICGREGNSRQLQEQDC